MYRAWLLSLSIAIIQASGLTKIYECSSTSLSNTSPGLELGSIKFAEGNRNASFISPPRSLQARLAVMDDPEIYKVGTETLSGSFRSPGIYIAQIQQDGHQIQESLTFYLDMQDNIFHVEYDIKPSKALEGFDVRVTRMQDQAPAPKVVMRPKDATKKTTKGTKIVETPEGEITIEEDIEIIEKTFLQKYWIYLIPLAAVFLLGGQDPENKQ